MLVAKFRSEEDRGAERGACEPGSGEGLAVAIDVRGYPECGAEFDGTVEDLEAL